jgi:hypothetical protein
VLMPLVYLTAWLMKGVRRTGLQKLPLCRAALLRVGVLPVRDHYYEPQFDFGAARPAFSEDRPLPGIDWNLPGQLAFLAQLRFSSEVASLPTAPRGPLEFHLNNGFFESGDAEVWYQVIRACKPKRVFEIGSGFSTLLALQAIRQNQLDDPGYRCQHVCVEPYEAPWLEQSGVTVLRQRVEDVELSFFAALEADDILFIDSSHVIRPQGDVVFEFLQLLPSLQRGVIVHVHDICSPKNYLRVWLEDEMRLWNEQYLLEAFLTHNHDWEVLAALNHLHHHHFERLKAVAPMVTPQREPVSFYLRKRA